VEREAASLFSRGRLTVAALKERFWRGESMKQVLVILFSTSLLFVLSVPAQATLYSPDLATIQGMSKAWDAAGTISSDFSKSTVGSAVRFVSTMQSGDGESDGWAAMGVGYPWPTPAPVSDLSSYSGYTLTFLNTNNSSWFVNLYMNTGWTDPPYNQPNNFYQNSWVELLPSVSTTLTLDFTGVVNLNHVTNIGFQVGGNMDVYPYTAGADNPSNPDDYHIDVSTVPEPATLALLGLSALLLTRKK